MLSLDKKTRDFTEVYTDYFTYVYSAVYSRLGNAHDAQDICQEVFIRFYDKYEEVENPRKWLLGAIRNVLLEFYRRKSGKEHAAGDLFDDVSLTFVNGFRDTRLLIEEAIENMDNFKTKNDKIVFDLIAMNNYTYKEAGKTLGLTVRQVRYQYSQTVNRIIHYFKEKGINSLDELL